MSILNRACGKSNCTSSLSSDQKHKTFGQGALSKNGFWEIPCGACARAFDELRDQIIEQTRQVLIQQGQKPEQADQYIQETLWLHNEGWPFADVDERDVNVGVSEGQLQTATV